MSVQYFEEKNLSIAILCEKNIVCDVGLSCCDFYLKLLHRVEDDIDGTGKESTLLVRALHGVRLAGSCDSICEEQTVFLAQQVLDQRQTDLKQIHYFFSLLQPDLLHFSKCDEAKDYFT